MTIALFDSGLGGLTVLAELRRLLPQNDLLYLADSACCPYGPRPRAWVCQRSLTIARFLANQGTRLLVVACNTASAAALDHLRQQLAMPVVGMEPGVKPAATLTRSGIVGVLTTSSTASSERYAHLITRFAHGVTVLTQPCPGLADQIDQGDLDGPYTRLLLKRFLQPMLAAGADTIVLGCTHYPLVAPLIRELAGPQVTLVDTGPAVARQVAARAAEGQLGAGTGALHCRTTGQPALLEAMLHRLELDATSLAQISLPDPEASPGSHAA
jgi:glutamate racemase